MKKFSELVAGDKVYTKLESEYFEEEVLENFEYDWQLITNLDCYQFADKQLESEFDRAIYFCIYGQTIIRNGGELMIINRVPNFSSIKTEKVKREKDSFNNILEYVLNVRYKELEKIKVEIKKIKKNTSNKKNRLLLERFIIEIEKEQGISH